MDNAPKWQLGPDQPGADPFGSPVRRDDGAPPPAHEPPAAPVYPEPRYPSANQAPAYRAPEPPSTPPYETPRYRRPRKGEAPPLDAFGAPVRGGFPGASQYEPQFSRPEPSIFPVGRAGANGRAGRGPRRQFSLLAILALALSLAAVRYIWPGPIGLILGIIALRHLRRDGGRGRGVAIAGIVIGGMFTLLLLVAIVWVLVSPSGADAASGLVP